jgi:putative ABC transport system substrate-binding protein
LGWIIGRNIQIDNRWTKGDADDARKYAAELVALAPARHTVITGAPHGV